MITVMILKVIWSEEFIDQIRSISLLRSTVPDEDSTRKFVRQVTNSLEHTCY